MSKLNLGKDFKLFAANLEEALKKYEAIAPKELIYRQRDQLRKLVALETKLRNILIVHPWGPGVYKDFVKLICDQKRNILAARPYFRERQTTFTKYISPALKKKNDKTLYRYKFNWSFIEYLLKVRKWPQGGKVASIAREISQLRTEILEQNIPLAISQARIFWTSTPKSHLSYMDIVQIQCQGLLLAIDKFCPPNDKKMTERQSLKAFQSFRAVAIGIMARDRVNQYSLDSDVILLTGNKIEKKIKDFAPGDTILGVNSVGQTIETEVIKLHDHGTLEGYEVTFDDGYQIICSEHHKFLTTKGMVSLKDLNTTTGVLCEPTVQKEWLATSLRTDIADQKNGDISFEGVPEMYRNSEGGKKSEGGTFCASSSRGLEYSVRNELSKSRSSGTTSQNVFKMYRANKEQSLASEGLGQMVSRESREVARINQREKREILAGLGERPRAKTQAYGGQDCWRERMAENTSRKVFSTSGESSRPKEAFQNGNLHTYNSSLGFRQNTLCGYTQTSGFCESRPQNMDRNGRFIPFYRLQTEKISKGFFGYGSGQRRYVETGSYRQKGRNVNSDGLKLFQRKERAFSKIQLANMAYSDAPLTSTGSLVLRKVVRIRSVGKRRMYDIEVSHPKHNFLLPNGIVTSNSETLIHFFPNYKALIYKANKLLRFQQENVDSDALAKKINREFAKAGNKDIKTNGVEIASLLAAASTVSADFTPNTTGDDSQDTVAEKFADNEDNRPDVRLEEQQALASMKTATYSLNLFDRKLLKLKGVSL